MSKVDDFERFTKKAILYEKTWPSARFFYLIADVASLHNLPATRIGMRQGFPYRLKPITAGIAQSTY